ncbi:hypothetical protein PR003_g22316 [Phytophthora rubi]|uniref:Uncharacterized protein n=1 Tax=Phytophthora rubi TaxID=129364 RepID=A0A6A3J9Z0_9STRA|nr:hypothetical protein PR002_g21698 [Phytophthora rubi]KAE8991480.1 hypothetical protein PR001_g21213 [Phytophthora rubi]KAE9302250.1 hypothetical protein PR003_g22316 [Phytophthora rubi]
MNHWLPLDGITVMHCSANKSKNGDRLEPVGQGQDNSVPEFAYKQGSQTARGGYPYPPGPKPPVPEPTLLTESKI